MPKAAIKPVPEEETSPNGSEETTAIAKEKTTTEVEEKTEAPVLNEDAVVVATDEEIEEIVANINLEELDESDLSPVYPGGKPYLVLKDKYIPYEKGLIVVQTAKVKRETEKLEKLKAQKKTTA